MNPMLLSLDGLSVGDAFGDRFFRLSPLATRLALESRQAPLGPWPYTDDTERALSIVEVLNRSGSIDQDGLARAFASRYAREPGRGYGAGARRLLDSMGDGLHWSVLAPAMFEGQGSMGNGGAMRVAPLGAHFASDTQRLVTEAQRSAEVTHSHPEGIAGTIAVALAAAFAWNRRGQPAAQLRGAYFDFVLAHTPDSQTSGFIERAAQLPLEYSVETAVAALGNGVKISAPDTVPFALWCAARHLDDYPSALWTAVEAGGDMDTMGAIVGGIVALSAVERGVPEAWLAARESLRWETSRTDVR